MLRWSQSRAGAQQTLSRRALGRLPVNNITKQPLALTSSPTVYEKYRVPHQANLVTEKKKSIFSNTEDVQHVETILTGCGTLAPEAGAYSLESPLAELHGFLLTPAHMNEMKILY